MRAVVLLCLVVLATAEERCNYEDDLINDYLQDEPQLYCFDREGQDHVIDEYAELCTEPAAFGAAPDDMEVLCADSYILVGYRIYDCDTDTGELAESIESDSILTKYSHCLNDTDTAVCTSVQTAAATSKLLVDTTYTVDNVDLQSADDDSIVYYSLICDDGYGFSSDVSDTVYGYCSDNSAENLYTFHASSPGSSCFEMCPANPGSSDIDSAPENFDSIDIVAQQSGASVTAAVICDSGFDVESGADEEYTFTCTGVEEGPTAYGGTYSCVNCPVCRATCPANPSASDILDDIDNVVSLVIDSESQSQQVVEAGVVCDTGFSVEGTYSFLCNSSSTDLASAGLYVLVGDAPVCKPTCGSNSAVEDDGTSLIEIAAGDYGAVVNGTVHCDSTHSLPYGDSDQYEFVCSDGTDEAEGGAYACSGDCPVCEEMCTLPTDDPNFNYTLSDGSGDDVVPSGEGHIEISCKNSSLNLVGFPYASCLSGANLTAAAAVPPQCLDVDVCEAPGVMNGAISTVDNLEVGGVYTITCNPSYYFDTTTAGTYAAAGPGEITETDYFEIEVTCDGEELPDFSCYFGCLPPDFSGGVTWPDVQTDGAAPYEMGAAVTFNCLDGANIEAGEAEATCDVGGIPSPICGACSFSLAISLISSLLAYLLL